MLPQTPRYSVEVAFIMLRQTRETPLGKYMGKYIIVFSHFPKHRETPLGKYMAIDAYIVRGSGGFLPSAYEAFAG